ncbi:class II fructose-bisphosphate aldolase [Cohnella sp. 56]|uniref:class II fructose-bisphosphate aldolase n=1 Tax=Cohnella sp. 56 TaxID=3113722 RepID=UPI0030EAC602
MHGATGVPDAGLKRLVQYRAGKTNIGTALRMAFGRGLREAVASAPTEFDRLKWFAASMPAVQAAASNKILILGNQGRV